MQRTKKWTLLLISLMLGLLGITLLYGNMVTNPKIAQELRADPNGERAGIVMLLTFADGRQLPVNYLREGDLVFVGADGPWWRKFRGAGERVTVEIRGKTWEGNAVAIEHNPEYTAAVFKRLRPSVPSWLPDWLNGTLVVISLNT